MSQVDPPHLIPDPIAAARRDDGSLTTEDRISAYETGPQQAAGRRCGLTPDQLRARPIEGGWSTLEVLCHLADCEQFFADRMKRTIAMDRPLLIGAEGSRYPGPPCYHDRDVGEEIELIRITRGQMARILRPVPARRGARRRCTARRGW
jgi:hypothetical protein